MSKVLVVHFSRSGHTRAAAKQVAGALDADLEEITEPRDRRGVFGYLRSSFEAFFQRLPRIDPARHDVSKYELVIVGTPIWNVSLASPMRSWLTEQRRAIRQLAVLLTCGGMGMDRALRQIEEVSRHAPCAHTVVTDRDRARGTDRAKLDRFVEALQQKLLRRADLHAAAE